MTAPAIAFYLLVWVFAIQPQGGKVENGGVTFDKPLSQLECTSQATEYSLRNPLEQMKKNKRDKVLYSRFVCVPVPMPPGQPA